MIRSWHSVKAARQLLYCIHLAYDPARHPRNNEDGEPREEHQMEMMVTVTLMMMKKAFKTNKDDAILHIHVYATKYGVQALDCYSIKTSTRRISKRMHIAEPEVWSRSSCALAIFRMKRKTKRKTNKNAHANGKSKQKWNEKQSRMFYWSNEKKKRNNKEQTTAKYTRENKWVFVRRVLLSSSRLRDPSRSLLFIFLFSFHSIPFQVVTLHCETIISHRANETNAHIRRCTNILYECEHSISRHKRWRLRKEKKKKTLKHESYGLIDSKNIRFCPLNECHKLALSCFQCIYTWKIASIAVCRAFFYSICYCTFFGVRSVYVWSFGSAP